AGPDCDAQVMVWQDLAAFHTGGPVPRFVKAYARLGDELRDAAGRFAREVHTGTYPGPEHSYH
ncbi:MAG: 3-methyl-2-oxobutanoate hydroxymethyltransferase, partial [Pseudonocardiaceae bacterium]